VGVTPYRARLYRLIFAAAAAYNIAFGLWAALRPLSFFALFDLAPPMYPSIWACLGMVVGLYGLGYAYAALRLDRAAPFIVLGLLGKLLGPAGWVLAVSRGELPIRTLGLILFNDVIWWLPFALFLLEGTRVSATLRRLAPAACAATNLAAIVAMGTALRFGTEIVPLPADRIAYIAAHPVLWRAGWSLWIAAAVSLVAFYAWWGGFLEHPGWGVSAVAVAAAGLSFDLTGESLLIGWLPRDYDRLARAATLLTGAGANGLYTFAGILLTVATPSLRGFLRATTWAIWLAGAALTVFALAGTPLGIAISTTIVFVMFCPWVLLVGRALGSRAARLP
jgi:small multidrug resistance pump